VASLDSEAAELSGLPRGKRISRQQTSGTWGEWEEDLGSAKIACLERRSSRYQSQDSNPRGGEKGFKPQDHIRASNCCKG